MKYYVFSCTGRTASKRLCGLLNNTVHAKSTTSLSCPYSITNDNLLVKTSDLNLEHPSVELFENLPDGAVIHSHGTMLPEDTDNWTFILTTRKSMAEQIMSSFISAKLNNWNPIDPSIGLDSFELEEKNVLGMKNFIEEGNKNFMEKTKNFITIYLEDSIEEIEQKLGVSFTLEGLDNDKKWLSNHHYKDIIKNYEKVFEWCGENIPC